MSVDTLENRLARFQAAIDLRPGDRTPVALMMDYKFPCRYKGVTQGEYFRDKSIGAKLLEGVFDELGGWDIARAGGNTTGEQNLLEAPMVIKVPGKDIGEDEVIQWEEREVITVEDYDRIINVGWTKFMEDFYPRFRGWDAGAYRSRIEFRAPRERQAQRVSMQKWIDKGYPVWGGGDVFPPLMMLSSCRSMTRFALDLHRMPDKVQAVMDAMIDDLIEISVNAAKRVQIPEGRGILTKTLIMERGGGFYFPLKVFERFELPYMKKMVDAFVKEGITPVLHFDQDWTVNLPYLRELPRAKCFMQLDSKTNIFKAKELLGDHMCIMGDVPPALLSLGTAEEASAYCRKLIEVVGKGGGFILGVGCGVPVDAKFANLKAMVDAPQTFRS